MSRLFEESEKHGITAVKQILPMTTLIDLLRTTGPLIVLVNSNLLCCIDCPWNFIESCLPCHAGTNTYQGHYVLAVGYDQDKKLIYYRNPTYTSRKNLTYFTTTSKHELRMAKCFGVIYYRNLSNVVTEFRFGSIIVRN